MERLETQGWRLANLFFVDVWLRNMDGVALQVFIHT